MFLINSRTPLVSATCGRWRSNNRRHPFYRRYGANLPNSLARSCPIAWAFSARGPFSVLGTVVPDRSGHPFHGHQGSAEPAYAGPSQFSPLLAITALQGLILLSRSDDSCRPTPMRRMSGLRCRTYRDGTGILTRFPFAEHGVTARLRTDSPSVDFQCRGTLALPAEGNLTPLSLLLAPGSSFPTAPQDLTALLLGHRNARLPDHGRSPCPRVSAAGLSPVRLRRPPPRRVSCYALLRGWLLLSLPPRCLRRGTTFDALSRLFGALTRVWVVSLSERRFTPPSPTPAFYGA